MLKVCGLPKTISINGEAPEVDVIATSHRSSMKKNKIQPEDIESEGSIYRPVKVGFPLH